jgi:hypothetical protein
MASARRTKRKLLRGSPVFSLPRLTVLSIEPNELTCELRVDHVTSRVAQKKNSSCSALMRLITVENIRIPPPMMTDTSLKVRLPAVGQLWMHFTVHFVRPQTHLPMNDWTLLKCHCANQWSSGQLCKAESLTAVAFVSSFGFPTFLSFSLPLPLLPSHRVLLATSA